MCVAFVRQVFDEMRVCVCVNAGEVGGAGADAEAGKRRELAEQAGHSP